MDCQHCRAAKFFQKPQPTLLAGPILQTKKVLQDICMFLDWTNWTFWVTALALIAFGFNLRVIYEQWRFWKIRKRPDEEIRELTQRLRTATERLNKANADAASKSRLRR